MRQTESQDLLNGATPALRVRPRAKQAPKQPPPAAAPGRFRILPVDDPALPEAPVPGPGWRALHAVQAGGVAIIELRHDDGDAAEWFFDAQGRHSSTRDAWPRHAHAAVADAFVPAVQALRDACLVSGSHPVPAQLADFARLGPRLRALLADTLQPGILPDPEHVDLDAAPVAPPPWPALRQTLAADFQHRLAEGLRQGALTWPSPIDASPMFCTGGFSLDDFNALYRFREPATGLDLFVLATEHLARMAGLYVPALGRVMTQGHDQSSILRQHFPRLGQRLLHHLAVMADSLLAGRRQMGGHVQLAAYLRGNGSAHLGHQLWNELTAIDELCAELPPARLPLWLVPGERTEFYGPTDALYPALSGRVRRGFECHAALTRHAYENRLVLFRPARARVGADLRRRVMARAVANAPPPPPGPAFMLGLRVENRTAIDLESLFALFIAEAARIHPGCAVILDGHNARGDHPGERTIGSYREEDARQSPLAIERALAQALRARFDGHGVRIHDTLGEPLATSLAWAQSCAGFFALWGAGLAKYCWAARKPGLVITNRWNLERKGDLRIYDDPAFMADPAPLAFVAPAAVIDQPTAPMLVPFDLETYSNFDFDPAAVRRHVIAFLKTPGLVAPGADP